MSELYVPQWNVVLHQPEIPPNTGAVGRTCVALQAKLWLVKPLGFRTDEKTLRRAGLDYWQHLNWEVVDHWEHLRQQLPTPNERCWYFSRFAERSFWDVELAEGDTFVFGCETSGLPKSLTAQYPEQLLRLPTTGAVRSINLSCSVAVCLFEAQRQKLYGHHRQATESMSSSASAAAPFSSERNQHE